MGYKDRCDVSEMLGKTLVSVVGCKAGSEKIIFTADTGESWKMFHVQDCCEFVAVEDVCGNVDHLIGSPLLICHESSSEPEPDYKYSDDSHTWTFYRIGTINGTVVLRWLGESSGFYSESVDFERQAPGGGEGE